MSLHQVDLGTTCKVLSTGEEGTLKKIYHYPTRFEVETADGRVKHYTTHDLEISGVSRAVPQYKSSVFPTPDANFATSSFSPFCAESTIQHFFSTTPDILWKTITSLSLLNVWMPRVQRALPIVDVDRYVSQFSFDRIELKSGTQFKIRPFSLSNYFKCTIKSFKPEKELILEMRFSPLYKEVITFSLDVHELGVFVKYHKKCEGLFSFLSIRRFYDREAHTLSSLDSIVPKVDFNQTESESSQDSTESQWGGFGSREEYIAYAINMGIQGNMDVINSISEKPTRGLAKAGLVRAKRTGAVPPMPEISSTPASIEEPSSSESEDELIARLIADGISGDMDEINALESRVLRGKIKAAIVKAKRAKS
ncbi:MAG: hypothetical protein ISR83_00885 [Candidatus Marinimicrobia bacterium]|nr:hypothetical protein [Candidatus Neomarinimicrobiota bacterium]